MRSASMSASKNIITIQQIIEYDVVRNSNGYRSLLIYLDDSQSMWELYLSPQQKLETIELIVGAWFVGHGAKAFICHPTGDIVCHTPIPSQQYISLLISKDIEMFYTQVMEDVVPASKEHSIRFLGSGNIIITCFTQPPTILRNNSYLSCLSYVQSNLDTLSLPAITCSINCWIVNVRARCLVELQSVPCLPGCNNTCTCANNTIKQGYVISLLAQQIRNDIDIANDSLIREARLRSIRNAGASLKTRGKDSAWASNPVVASLDKKARVLWKEAGFRQCTRLACSKMTKLLELSSRSKNKLEYKDNKRHCLGDPIKFTPINHLLRTPIMQPDPTIISRRLKQLAELEAIHDVLLYCNMEAPRDNWETWIMNFAHLEDCDIAFMCLVTIIMSSSTSDNLLSSLMPKLFCAGLTSPRGVIELVNQFGVDGYCALLAPSGRYYQNAERILNAADYFVQRHHGRIPKDISITELCSLLGIGYKTANIVVTTAFHRMDGIPSDMHVICWSALLGWTKDNISGLECSKSLEQWLPKDRWGSINPLFGALGQLLSGRVSSQKLFCIVKRCCNAHMLRLFQKAKKEYSRRKAPKTLNKISNKEIKATRKVPKTVRTM